MLFVLYPEFLDIIRGEKDCSGLKSILDSTRSLHTLLFLCIRHIFFFPPSFKKDTFASYKILSFIFFQHFEGIISLLLASMFLMRSELISLIVAPLKVKCYCFPILKMFHRVSCTSVLMSCIISGISSDIRSLRNTCFC